MVEKESRRTISTFLGSFLRTKFSGTKCNLLELSSVSFKTEKSDEKYKVRSGKSGGSNNFIMKGLTVKKALSLTSHLRPAKRNVSTKLGRQ